MKQLLTRFKNFILLLLLIVKEWCLCHRVILILSPTKVPVHCRHMCATSNSSHSRNATTIIIFCIILPITLCCTDLDVRVCVVHFTPLFIYLLNFMHKQTLYNGGLNAMGIFFQSTLGWCRELNIVGAKLSESSFIKFCI